MGVNSVDTLALPLAAKRWRLSLGPVHYRELDYISYASAGSAPDRTVLSRKADRHFAVAGRQLDQLGAWVHVTGDQ